MAPPKNHIFLRSETKAGHSREYIFWSPRETHFPYEIPSRMMDREDLYDYNPKDAWTLHWSKNKIPHLMFIPAHPTFEGPIFQRLACSLTSVPLERIDDFWFLRSDLRNQWERLEVALEVVTKTLYGDRMFSLGYKHKWPSTFGYLRGHMNAKTARRCAIKSRDGFVELMGLCAHAIALRGPDWMDTLRENMSDYQPVWIENLANSLAGDIKNVPRVGVIVDPSRCEWLTWIPRLKQANVPIYFYWGYINSKGHPVPCEIQKPSPDLGGPTQNEVVQFLEDMSHCFSWNRHRFGQEGFLNDLVNDELEFERIPMPHPPPPGSALAELYARLPTPWPIYFSQYLPSTPQQAPHVQSPRFSSSSVAASSPQLHGSASSITPALPSNMSRFPTPKKRSRQDRGETWQEFFARQERRHQVYLAQETNEQRQSRKGREEYAKTPSAPSKRSTVFQWLPDEDTGFLMREIIYNGLVENFWDHFSSTQRRFNAIDDEWDLCEEFDPTVVTETDSEDQNDYDDYMGSSAPAPAILDNSSSVAPASVPPRVAPSDIFNVDLLDIYRPELESELLVPPLPLERILFQRYGYSPPPQYVARQPIVDLRWDQTRAILCDSTNEAAVESQAPILEFVSYLLNQPTHQCIPPSVSDLSDTSLYYLQSNPPSVLHRRILYQTLIPPNQALETVPAFSIYINSTRLLLVDKAATILHILRKKWDPTSAGGAIVSYLLGSGTPFRIVTLRVEKPAVTTIPNPIIGLGVRDKGFQAGPIDYVAYEQARDILFSNETVLRSALQEGGILWRLAQDYLKKDLGTDCVLAGPSSFAHVGGRPFLIEDHHYIDDQLTNEQIGLICGVYKVRTDSERYTDQIAEMSWWPKPNAWGNGGLNVGYWSADCESWYQRRLETIRAAKVQLRSGAEWRQALRLQKKARGLVHSYEQAATLFLQGHHFH